MAKAPEPRDFALYVEKLYHRQILFVKLVFIQKGPIRKVAAEKSISVEIDVNMFAYTTLILAGVPRDVSVVEVVGATLGACSVMF